MEYLFLSLTTLAGFCYYPNVMGAAISPQPAGAQFTAYCDKRFCEVIQKSADELNRQAKEKFKVSKNFIHLHFVHRPPKEAIRANWRRVNYSGEKMIQELRNHDTLYPELGNLISEISFGPIDKYIKAWHHDKTAKADGIAKKWYDFSFEHGGVQEADIIISDNFYINLHEPEHYFNQDDPKPSYYDKTILESNYKVPLYWYLETVIIHEMLHAAVGLDHTEDKSNTLWAGDGKYDLSMISETNISDEQWEAIFCIYYGSRRNKQCIMICIKTKIGQKTEL